MSVYADLLQNAEYPVICTRGVLIFPNQEVLIEVGRTMSINALKASQKRDSLVFLTAQKELLKDNPEINDIYQYGTICEITSSHFEKGLYKAKFKGISRAKALNMYDNTKCLMTSVDILQDELGDHVEEMALIKRVVEEFQKSNEQFKSLAREFLNQITAGSSSSSIADQFAQIMPMPLEARQQILAEVNVNSRLLLIIKQFELSKVMKNIDEEITQKVKDSIDDNQKEYVLREKMRAIKEELGEAGGNDDTDSLIAWFKDNPYPENIRAKALEEINKFQMTPSISAESSVIKNYIDWLQKVPFWQVSQDNTDINDISRILNEDHYGLKKVKERVLEYIAVKNMTGSLKAPILCLYGPPGVGKTSLAKSIARAINRQFVKISLGGVKDEAEIRGHRRTYLGSMPGRIIQGMKRAGTINPVFLIDELDKMGMDYKGDPASAMLEVLDPEQNNMFSDNYLEEAYDLSKVMFIATANDISTIPAALRDRLEIIEMQSYTEDEKVNIALNHLIKKELSNNGLKESQFKLKEDEILYIIRYYTREAGVRQLQRCISTLCRKVVLSIAKGERKSCTINKKLIVEFLGKEIYEYGDKDKEDQIGVVTGLAYTQFGGDTLPIEVTTYPGKGKLIITGNLGDVMKESATIALGYVKSNCKKFDIEDKKFDEIDIQIHCPEGAVPKDGPSAGITLTTAIISALTGKKVSHNLAMTGEITLRGNVLPIGGLREKTMAAHRTNITNVIVPNKNMKDLDEIDQVVKDSINFIPVKTYNDVYKNVFEK